VTPNQDDHNKNLFIELDISSDNLHRIQGFDVKVVLKR
jgi:hypothetical protein